MQNKRHVLELTPKQQAIYLYKIFKHLLLFKAKKLSFYNFISYLLITLSKLLYNAKIKKLLECLVDKKQHVQLLPQMIQLKF